MYPNYKCSITRYRSNQFYISLYLNNARYRYYNGHPIGQPDRPNLLPIDIRFKGFQELLIKFHVAIRGGWSPICEDSIGIEQPKALTVDFFDRMYREKLKENLSHHVYKDLRSYISRMIPLVEKEINEDTFQKMADKHSHWNNTTFNNYIRYASLIEKGLTKYGYTGTWSKKVIRRRKEEKLHKKFSHVQTVLSVLFSFNRDLHLCALLTYGCLLRPFERAMLVTQNRKYGKILKPVVSLDPYQILNLEKFPELDLSKEMKYSSQRRVDNTPLDMEQFLIDQLLNKIGRTRSNLHPPDEAIIALDADEVNGGK